MPTPASATPRAAIKVTGPLVERAAEILTPAALEFLSLLHARFAATRDDLIERRSARRAEVAQTASLNFLPETEHIRNGDWTVAPAPADLLDRRVEITGPTDRKMAINALNSGAKVWLADLEDANTPHWQNVIGGQVTLLDAVAGTLAFDGPDGRQYRLRDRTERATIIVRPRGWHLPERHITFDGEPAIGALVDFGLYFFHNAHKLIDRGSGPYFYLPKMESHLEARLWNDVFTLAESELEIPYSTIRATALIETIPAAFEMAEILYELRDHASGLNAGRWDYLFSIIKYFRDAGPQFVLPDRSEVSMTAPFMRAYTEELVRTCHQHGAFAMGGMAAFIPSRRDEAVNQRAFAKVREDKEREVADGFDGSWVAHPDLVPLCREIFDVGLAGSPNQLLRLRADVSTDPKVLLDLSGLAGGVTSEGVRANVRVGIRYLAAWLDGNGAVAIDNLMEDAATAEISRSQLWQWLHYGVVLADTGEVITAQLIRSLTMELRASTDASPAPATYHQAADLFESLVLEAEFPSFLTLAAYQLID